MTDIDLPQLPPSGIGEAAKYNFEPWFIKIRFQDQSPLEGRRWKDATKPLSILQSNIGNKFEQSVYDELDSQAYEHINTWFDWDSEENKNQIIDNVKKVANRTDGKPTILTQARLKGKIKLFNILGDADLIILFPTDDGVHINVIDIKASWDEKPYQQLQTATYTILLRNILDETDINYTISGGIVYRETDLDSVLKLDETPQFHIETREGDVKRILQKDGPFERAFTTKYKDMPLSINKQSPYAEVCIVKAIENGDLSLLGLSPGEKQKLKENNIDTIQDVAKLYELVEDAKPYNHDDFPINPEYEEKINKLNEDATLSENLPLLAQKAQAFLGDLNPDNKYAHDKPWFSWLHGVGSADLPEDNPPYDADLPIKKNSLIRVYLNIQYDHIRDSIVAISGRVTSGLYKNSPLTFSRVIDNINTNPDTWGKDEERELLEDSFQDIFKTIQMIGGLNNQKEAGIHFYVYGQDEYDALYESVKRHQNVLKEASAMRNILDRRNGIDQKMISIVEKEIENRFAIKQIDTSLPAIVQRTYPNDAYAQFSNSDWTISHHTGEEINLKNAFKQQLFDYHIPIAQNADNLASVLNENTGNDKADDFYALLPRNGAQIPIEYLWASEDIEILDTTWSDDDTQKNIIRNYKFATENKDIPITSSMFGTLSGKFAHALHHVERSISYRTTDIEKSPIELNKLSTKKPQEGTLAKACRDYLDLESEQTKNDAYDVYMKPLKKRIIDGESVPIRITDIVQDKGYMFRAKGELLYKEFGFKNATEIAGSSRIGGSGKTTGGTRCVATPLTKSDGTFKVKQSKPHQIARGVKVSVDEYDPNSNKIVIDGYRTSSKLEFEYVLPRQPWSLDSDNERQPYIGENEMFVLDPNPDNTMAEKSIKALRHAESNPVYMDINKIRNSQLDIQNTRFTDKGVKEYINWAEDALEFKPNEKQQKFIKETSRYSLLQGPPGTGKTSGALSQALMARAYDGQIQDNRVTSLVTGLSNKSVDEVMSDVVELLDRFDNEFGTHKLENTRIVRLAYNKPEDAHDKVEYLNYNNDTDINILCNLIMPVGTSHQQTLNSSQSDGLEHLIVFGTPGRIDGLVGKLFDGATAEEGYKRAYNFFDVLALDEASMMPMYQLFMASAFVNNDAQIMLAGDQRQLSPVQTYEWNDENKTSVINHLPHLSALDYFRYLRGEPVDRVYDDSPPSPEANIPITRLNETYRCHETVTEFLRQTVYNQDGIKYVSSQNDTIPKIDTNINGLNCALKSDSPLTIVIHNDRKSRQVNLVEGTMLSALTKVIPDSESMGIVTPHNAQKGKLNVLCPSSEVDTVERFQGGEKDIMFLSTTVSDPSHLSDEEEFILSQNRINVALSRMKKKLIVLVPESLFEIVPKDVDIYDEARIWKALYAISAAQKEPDWTGNVSEFVDGDYMIPGSKTNLKVYNIKDL